MMKECKFNELGTKMILDTGMKIFDNQCKLISTGNVISRNQVSMYVRPMREGKNKVDHDMIHFSDAPIALRKMIYSMDRTESVILYRFRLQKGTVFDTLGWVLTSKDYDLITYMVCRGQRYGFKREMCIKEILKYITN